MAKETSTLSTVIDSYCLAVAQGGLPRAYRGILAQLSQFQTAWEQAHPQDNVGALYPGYLDMSFVAIAPAAFGARRLKISLVYLHEDGRFTLWLTAGNRSIQAEVSNELAKKPLGAYSLTVLKPGVDAIISKDIPLPYFFDEPERLTAHLMDATEHFLFDMSALLEA